MIITRTPLRISIGGGGTDLESYYGRFGGFVLSAAIDRYVYIAINQTFTNDYFLKYSQLERVSKVDEIKHPIIREVLTAHDIGPSVEIVSVADIPAGTGLGSSGTFTVGLLRAAYAFERRHVTDADLAEEACSIEIDRMGQAVGKQDQYIASFGGITCFEIGTDGSVDAFPVAISTDTLHDLDEHLLMFFTGYSRSAAAVLEDQKRRSESDDVAMLENLHHIKAIGVAVKEALEDGDTRGYGKLMHAHWLFKRERSSGMTNPDIDRWYELGIANGATGGKLVGAGSGGFLLFYAEDPSSLRAVMAAEGLTEVRYSFDFDGSSVLTRD